MGAEKHHRGGSSWTKPPQSGTAPPRPSGPAPASLPGCTDRLLTIASTAEKNADLRETIGQLLEVLTELEPRSVAGVHLAKTATRPELVLEIDQTRIRLGATPQLIDGRLFPDLSEEHIVALLEPVEGTIHFGASCFEAGPFSEGGPTVNLRALLDVLARVVTMVVRALDAEAELATSDATVLQLQKLAAIGRSTAGITHELNNPLTAIVATTDLITRQLSEDDLLSATADRLRRISEAANRAQQFCCDLTDYSRPSNRLRAPVDLDAIIDRALGFCMHDLRDAEVTIERRYHSLPVVLGIDTQLIQLFVNLITNAGDAMLDCGGTLCLETKVSESRGSDTGISGRCVVIAIADEGRGINEQDLPRIFDSYFTTKPKGSGVGLGLDIVQRIVAHHGGTIYAEPREPRGTVFYVELPVGNDREP